MQGSVEILLGTNERARVLMCDDVIRQTCMTRATIDDLVSEVSENTFFSHFPDHCIVYACFECSLIFIFELSCSILSERAQN